MNHILFSVIICTYNRAILLSKCLDSLLEQQFEYQSYEVIIVDNNSTDETKELTYRYQPRMKNLRYSFEGNQGLSYARNRGCAEAQAEYLVYLDDDALAPPGYLANIAQTIEKHQPDIMGGPVYPYYLSPKPFWFRDEYETKKHEPRSCFSRTCGISGGNFIIRKSVLEKIGLFDVNLGMKGNALLLGEDREIVDRYRTLTPENEQKVYYTLECYIKHYVPEAKMKLKYRIQRYYRNGKDEIKSSYRGPDYAALAVFFLVKEVIGELISGKLIRADCLKIAGSFILRFGNIKETIRVFGFRKVLIAGFKFTFGSSLRTLISQFIKRKFKPGEKEV